MNKNGLRYNLRKNRILKAASQCSRQVVFPTTPSIQRIGCISDYSIELSLVRNNFSPGVQVNFIEFSAENRAKGNESETIFLSDLNFWGVPPGRLIQKFTAIPFDILINFASEQQEVVHYICASSVAKFKVSKQSSSTIYDLVINSKTMDDAHYLKEIIRTLNNFNN